jgi:hypothetical protein
MWYADNDSMYCSARAYELKDKYKENWGFSCITWPDTDGIDKLSPTHRVILDLQLKELMTQGENAEEPFQVTHVKTAASTPLDNQPGTLALQFFLSDGTDRTQIIVDEKDSWELFATIDNLASRVSSDTPISSALVTSITDSAALEVLTTVVDGPDRQCQGRQVLLVRGDNQLDERTAHHFVCQPDILASRSPD